MGNENFQEKFQKLQNRAGRLYILVMTLDVRLGINAFSTAFT